MKTLNNFINESLIKKDSKINSKHILSENDLSNINDALYNSGKYTGCCKFCYAQEQSIDYLDEQLKQAEVLSFNDQEKTEFSDYLIYCKEYAEKNSIKKILVDEGRGHKNTWTRIVFFSTDPYIYCAYHSWHGQTLIEEATDEETVINNLVKFVKGKSK